MVVVYGYNGCSTVKKSLKFLKQTGVEYTHIDNVVNPLTKEQLMEIHQKSQQDLKKLFNTSGVVYRELNLKDKYNDLTEDEKFDLLASDGKLVKRPIMVNGEQVLIGFKEQEWETII